MYGNDAAQVLLSVELAVSERMHSRRGMIGSKWDSHGGGAALQVTSTVSSTEGNVGKWREKEPGRNTSERSICLALVEDEGDCESATSDGKRYPSSDK